MLYRQQQQIDAALNLNEQLLRQLATIEAKSADPAETEIPPHY